jgi:hypothetical protein
MNTDKTNTWFTNRQFVAMIRTALDAAGHADVAVSRQWIDEDTPGYPFLMHVPVGTALTVPLRAMDSFSDAKNVDDLAWHAGEFAQALSNLTRAEKLLEKYARDVRAAAVAEIAAARRDGLDVLLENVGFKPTYARHLTGKDWKDAAMHVLASVRIRHTSFYLRPETSETWVEEPKDVARELAATLEEQRERQEQIRELDALGADLIVDALTIELLQSYGFDAAEVLRDAWRRQCVNLKVENAGREGWLSIVTYGGRATASVDLGDAYWNGEYLWLADKDRATGNTHLIGKSLADLVQHPVFSSRPIQAVVDRHIDHFAFDLSDKLLFEAETGRTWREATLTA